MKKFNEYLIEKLVDKCPIKLKDDETIKVAILKSLNDNWIDSMDMFNNNDKYMMLFLYKDTIYSVQNWRGPWPKYNTYVDEFIEAFISKNKLKPDDEMDFGYYAHRGVIHNGVTPHAKAQVYYTELDANDFNKLLHETQNRINNKLFSSTSTIASRLKEIKSHL